MRRDLRRIFSRRWWTGVAVAVALAVGVTACHEEFDELPAPDLYKHPESFGFDLSASSDDDLGIPDMSAEEHHDLAKVDSN